MKDDGWREIDEVSSLEGKADAFEKVLRSHFFRSLRAHSPTRWPKHPNLADYARAYDFKALPIAAEVAAVLNQRWGDERSTHLPSGFTHWRMSECPA